VDFVQLLPFLEQKAMHDQIQAGDPTNPTAFPPGGPRGDASWAVWNRPPAVFRCPSDPGVLTRGNSDKGHNYILCGGDQVNFFNNSTNNRGMFTRLACRRFAEVTDGTSNTILMSETCCNVSTGNGGQSGFAANGVKIHLAYARIGADPTNSPQICRTFVDGPYYKAGTLVHGRRAINWTDSPACLICFNTVLPPNGPACVDTSSGDFGDQERAVLPPTSYHPGGVVAVLVDGSVRFFTDSINCGNLGAAQPAPSASEPYGGPSLYGVWGALGSIAGGDAGQVE
jgi:hypothetical protein